MKLGEITWTTNRADAGLGCKGPRITDDTEWDEDTDLKNSLNLSGFSALSDSVIQTSATPGLPGLRGKRPPTP
jgi:hypothetical protein